MSVDKVLPSDRRAWTQLLINLISLTLIVLFGVAFIFFFLTPTIGPRRGWLLEIVYLALIIIVSIVVIGLIGRFIRHYVVPRASPSVGSSLQLTFDVVAYIALFVGVFYLLGINITAVLVGAGFLGIVLGLAAQQVMGNFFGAIALMASHPFSVGERITVITWQYGKMAPTYPHETIPVGYTGTVVSIGLMFTHLKGDEGLPMTIPNGVLSGALIMNHTRAIPNVVRVHLALKNTVDFKAFVELAKEALKAMDDIFPGTVQAYIMDVGEKTYDIAVTASARNERTEKVASDMLGLLRPLLVAP